LLVQQGYGLGWFTATANARPTKAVRSLPGGASQGLLIVRPVVTQEEAYETEQKKLVPGM
jgi:hypothetical protein